MSQATSSEVVPLAELGDTVSNNEYEEQARLIARYAQERVDREIAERLAYRRSVSPVPPAQVPENVEEIVLDDENEEGDGAQNEGNRPAEGGGEQPPVANARERRRRVIGFGGWEPVVLNFPHMMVGRNVPLNFFDRDAAQAANMPLEFFNALFEAAPRRLPSQAAERQQPDQRNNPLTKWANKVFKEPKTVVRKSKVVGVRKSARLAELEKGKAPSTSQASPNQENNEPETAERTTDQWGECTVCFATPTDPMGCISCLQMVGCRDCCKDWVHTTIANNNNASCPLCRKEWGKATEVMPMTAIERRKRMKNN